MKFYTQYDKPPTKGTPTGQETEPTFNIKINEETGKKELVQTGETNTYEKIQASLEQTKVYNILDRYNNGEIEILDKNKGIYADITNMPKNLAEAQQKLIDAENYFKTMPLDVRAKFNHSTSEFLASITNGRYKQILGITEDIKQELQETTKEIQPVKQEEGIKYE